VQSHFAEVKVGASMEINREELKNIKTDIDYFKGIEAEKKYVAFLDILGFGNQVVNEFEKTIEVYQRVLNSLRALNIFDLGVSTQIYSDSILFACSELYPIVMVVQAAQWQTLFCDCLVRGGIGYGDHLEVMDGKNYFVISQALVHAVQIEKTIKRPCVAFHDSVKIPSKYWNAEIPPVVRGVVHFDGISLVSPLTFFWGTSAITRAYGLAEDYPEHKDKYEWFIKLCEAILNGNPLVPQNFVA
jgi:hypothetical protein